MLLRYGARPGLPVQSETKTSTRDTPVMMAAAGGLGEILELLLLAVASVGLSGGNDLDQTNGKGETALHLACAAGQFESVQLLLQVIRAILLEHSLYFLHGPC